MSAHSQLRSLIDKANAASGRQAAETLRFVEEQKIKKVLAPKEWQRFCDQLTRECGNFSRSTEHNLQCESPNANELIARNANTAKGARFTYQAEMPCVSCTGFDDGGYFAFRVNSEGTALQWLDTKRNSAVSINDIIFEVTAYLIH